ncbi:3',5'-cyclic AMP phosphodiesterase CpdA [Bradyrhizobium sp. LM4.3]
MGGAAFVNKRRKMDRSFVIVHISDLHLDGTGRLLATIETLNAAIRERMADFANVPDRILMITGDLVDDPTPRALDEALAVIASLPSGRPGCSPTSRRLPAITT